MDKENFLYFIGVHKSLGLTPTRYKKLKKYFKDDWKSVFNSKINQLQEAELDRQSIEKFLTTRGKVDSKKEVEVLNNLGIKTLIYGARDYPVALQNISSPPIVLFLRGELREIDFPTISVVGSRGITAYGRRALEHIVGFIAKNNITIVSGLAIGADTMAHKVAIKNGAKTICVLGNGIDSIYPSQNKVFAEELLIKNKGAILSEYFPGTKPRPEYFPMRNRIVAGMSKATIVIEAAQRSGSLITARMALDEGREIFAVPGEIFSKYSKGCNELILNGEANPVLSGEQVLERLGLKNINIQKNIQEQFPLTEIEKQILILFGTEYRMHINDLFRKSSLSNPILSSNISLMEIKGIIKNIGNQTYVKNV